MRERFKTCMYTCTHISAQISQQKQVQKKHQNTKIYALNLHYSSISIDTNTHACMPRLGIKNKFNCSGYASACLCVALTHTQYTRSIWGSCIRAPVQCIRIVGRVRLRIHSKWIMQCRCLYTSRRMRISNRSGCMRRCLEEVDWSGYRARGWCGNSQRYRG